jgi:hypothetical protein
MSKCGSNTLRQYFTCRPCTSRITRFLRSSR